MTRYLLIILLLLIPLPVSAAGSVKARPQSGIGLLSIRSGMPLKMGDETKLDLYREPGLGRLGGLAITRLPGLSPSIPPVQGESHATVTSSRRGWLRIIYDDAERQGWVKKQRSLVYQKWEQLLIGREVSMLPGLRKEFYHLRSESSLLADSRETVEKDLRIKVLKVAGEWIFVGYGKGVSGWLRWRDDNARLMILLHP